MNSTAIDKGKKQARYGVIAVLFLFVAAFIFGAISLSMQTGQLTERRIHTDFAGDASAMAFASKSAQGLNFIAANNLAIAATSHMVGVLHVAADWTAMILTIIKAKSLIRGGATKLTKDQMADEVKTPYDILAPISKMYFRAAIGMTTLSKTIRSYYPYLGMIDAVSVGGANIPSAIVIPFRVPTSSGSSSSGASNSFMDKVKGAVKGAVASALSTVNLSYDGLARLNSDETFCLAYRAAEKANGADERHSLDQWITSSTFGITIAGVDLSPLGTVFELAGKVAGGLDVIGNFISIQIGFSGCGFGEEGPLAGGKSDRDQSMVARILSTLLQGPLSGRDFEMDTGLQKITLRPPHGEDRTFLENELNAAFRADCGNGAVQWATVPNVGGFKTNLDPRTGICVYEDVSNIRKKYRKNDQALSAGTNVSSGENVDFDRWNLLSDYKVACFGTILFSWDTFSGPVLHPRPDDPENNNPIRDPAFDSHPKVSKTDFESDVCPPFVANDTRGGPEYKYPSIPGSAPSYVNLSRKNVFVQPILKRLSDEDNGKLKDWRGNDLRARAFEKMNKALSCAAHFEEACTNNNEYYLASTDDPEGKGTPHKFYPTLESYNWLCPLAEEGKGTLSAVYGNLSFKHIADSRWLHSAETTLLGGRDVTTMHTRYLDIMRRHNERMKRFTDRIDCSAYEIYAKGFPVKPHKEKVASTSESHSFCADDAHMCWQTGMQKVIGDDLKNGELSFIVPKQTTPTGGGETDLEKSLHYAVFVANPIRTDDPTRFKGRNDGSDMAHCPDKLDVDVVLENNATVKVCDVQPVISMVSGMFKDQSGQQQKLEGDTSFGAGNANLASGGGINGIGDLTTLGFMAVSQASARYEANSVGEPARPTAAGHTNLTGVAAESLEGKSYQMFWPSWKPTLEPSRVFSKLLGSTLSSIVED
jgi:hypothetical protein